MSSSSEPGPAVALSHSISRRHGEHILILERGPFLPQEKPNWNTTAVFLDNWLDQHDQPLHPQQAYFVGGQTKVYGAILFRLRAEDFDVLQHKGGISPAWPLIYADFEPITPAPKSSSLLTAISMTT
jgi:choline dehydrogenase-like flavoprotein